MKVHCFFEQSGTFKNEFIKLGLDAMDYDIRDDFGQTDVREDIFSAIESAWQGENLFNVRQGDLIFAFFPCIRFSKLWVWHVTCQAKQCKGMDDMQKAIQFMSGFREMRKYADLVTKLVWVCLRDGIKLIIENPYDPQCLLNRYWPWMPSVIHKNRREFGDWFEKPTQYWFFNLEPKDNLLFDEPIAYYPHRKVDGLSQVEKSMISPDYARRFIRTYVL